MSLLRHMIGAVLRRARQRQRRTLGDVAKAAGVSLPYLSEVERGRKEASSEVLNSICRALGMSLAELLDELRAELLPARPPAARPVVAPPTSRPMVAPPTSRPAVPSPASRPAVARPAGSGPGRAAPSASLRRRTPGGRSGRGTTLPAPPGRLRPVRSRLGRGRPLVLR